jgi:hypothetical protein
VTARLRIQELPSEVDGDTVTYPFIWVLDRVGDLPTELVRETIERLGKAGGPRCQGALVFAQAVELADDAQPVTPVLRPTTVEGR